MRFPPLPHPIILAKPQQQRRRKTNYSATQKKKPEEVFEKKANFLQYFPNQQWNRKRFSISSHFFPAELFNFLFIDYFLIFHCLLKENLLRF
jgi:hypothetical protein